MDTIQTAGGEQILLPVRADNALPQAPTEESSICQQKGAADSPIQSEPEIGPFEDTAQKVAVRENLQDKPKPLTARERRDAAIRAELEDAKDPQKYATYTAEQWDSDSHLRIFSARRQGRGHILNNTPCQDYCLTEEGKGYILMAGSDGVSACARSDVGSRLVCEAVAAIVKSAAKAAKTEEILVKRLCGLQFRDRVVRKWIKESMADYRGNPTETPLEPGEQLYLYGATLMFVVITENWYIAGNLGDGQILFFNETDSVKLRVHPPKESSKVYCLVNSKCYLDGFQVAAYPRSWFNNVLLTTDGVYNEHFDSGQLLYQYGMQLRNRFLESQAPYLPFAYTFEDGITRDIYARKTDDDCTVLLAVDDRPCNERISQFRSQIDSHCDESILLRMGRKAALYGMMQNQQYFETVILPENHRVGTLPPLSGVRVESPVTVWQSDGFCYAVYPGSDVSTLEYLQCTGKLREQKETTPNASLYILEIYRKLRQCARELGKAGLMFREDAHFLIGMDSDTHELVLRPEAVCVMTADGDKGIALWSYFDILLGMLSCGSVDRPLFSGGYSSTGSMVPRMDGLNEGDLCFVEFYSGNNMLRNTSTEVWHVYSGVDVPPGEHLPLASGTSFLTATDRPGIWAQYRYTAKENL